MLRGALGAGVALPWLEAMMPRGARAQAVSIPKRLGVFFSPCGTIPENWRPTGLNPSTATPNVNNPAISTDFNLPSILAPLNDFKSDIVVLRGVSMESSQGKYGPVANVHDQGMTHMLTAMPLVRGPLGAGRANHFLDGSAGGPSIDQHIAKAIAGETLYPSLQFGVESTDTFLEVMVTRMTYGDVPQDDPTRRAVPLPPIDDPVQMYTRLFGTANQGTGAQQVAALRNRQSVLDYAVGDYNDLMSKVGSEDRLKLDQHLTNIRDIEATLTMQIAMGGNSRCPAAAAITPVAPARVSCLRDQDLRTMADKMVQGVNMCVTNFPAVGKLQMDLMILALQCDITRVATLQWSTAESTVIHNMWLPDFGLPTLGYGGTVEHHMLTHNETVAVTASGSKMPGMVPQARTDLTTINTWYTMQFAYMLGKLKAIQEANGMSLLDNMLMFWTNELGVGGVHSYTNIPYVLAGKCQGALQTGRYIDFLGPDRPTDPSVALPFGAGPAHNKLMVSLIRAMAGPAGSPTAGLSQTNSFNFNPTPLAPTWANPAEAPLFNGPLPGL